MPNPLDFQALLPPRLNKAHRITDGEHNVWGTNILRGPEGRYHALYSRWPKTRGHHAWVTHSEIAHAVADRLTGPYVFQNTALPARGPGHWDGEMTHNPHLLEHGGQYYLYYVGNHGSGHWPATAPHVMPQMDHPQWWVNRNHQRIGLATADHPQGPWHRHDRPLLDTIPGRLMTATPVVSVRPDGRLLMAYKYVQDNGTPRGGRVVHATALADHPAGPFVDTDTPFITAESDSAFTIDDHVQWHEDGRYHCIGKDCCNALSKHPENSMLLWTADAQGLNWTLAPQPLVIRHGALHWTDGTTTRCQRTADMPKIVIENGRAQALIFATLPLNSEVSFATVVPLAGRG